MEKTKYNPSFYLQDKISENPQLIKEALAGLYYVPTSEIAKLPRYIWVRYINARGLYRVGGILWGNYYPRYLILLNPKTRYPWRIGIKKNHFYVRDCKAKLREKYEKEKLHELYLDGKLEVSQSALAQNDNIDKILEAGRNFEPTDYAPLITTISKKDYEIQKQLALEEEELRKKQKLEEKRAKEACFTTIDNTERREPKPQKTQKTSRKQNTQITTRTVGTCTSPIPEFPSIDSDGVRDIKNKLFELYQDNLLTLHDPDDE